MARLRPRSLGTLLPAFWLLLFAFAATVAAQRGKPASADVPPVSMTCPMHPDVVESAPGTCPICKMNLVPMRLAVVWTCPVHSVVAEDNPGTCPICRRSLIQVTVAVTWTCANRPDISQIDRGTCPDGTPMVAQRNLRPHGNHNPQHGGQFFMAPDNFHHLEGAYPRARVFRLYLYDDYARPLPAEQIKRMKARVVTAETFDSASRTTTETAAFPLVPSRNGPYLEARVGQAALPAQMTAKIQFKSDAPEYRFDFTFPALTTEPAAQSAVVSRAATANGRTASASSPRTVPPAPPPLPASPEAAVAPSTSTPDASGALPARDGATIPATVGEMLLQLKSNRDQIGEFVRQGNFAAVWVPAFQAKDVAVALEARIDQLPSDKQDGARPAIARLVRTSWLLDAFGDIGNRQQIEDAYAIFTSAVAEVTELFRP